MRTISKGPEPRSLTAHRKAPGADYANYSAKGDLRRALAGEQRGLCCYCMGRIRPDRESMKIEHWHCQRNYEGEVLSYGNLLAACLGGFRQPKSRQYCDTKKGDRDLKWNPADSARPIETRIRYGLNGEIHSDDPVFDGQLTEVLNLNLPFLRSIRKGILDGLLDWWKHEKSRIHGPVTRDRLVRKRKSWIGGDGELRPYCQVAVWWIERRLRTQSA